MWKTSILAVGLWCCLPGPGWSLELKNVRFTYGSNGAFRPGNKFLPGDVLFLAFDIASLKVDPKFGKTRYAIVYEVLDSLDKLVHGKTIPQENYLGLGGNQVPGMLILEIAPKQPVGKYKVKLKVVDRLPKTPEAKVDTIPFEIVPATFGFVLGSFPAISVPGAQHESRFALVNMALDKKKMPKMEVTMRVLDAAGKTVASPVINKYPRDLPNETELDKTNFLPMLFLIFLNRPGRFTLAVDAHDKLADKKIALRVPLTVLDLTQYDGSKAAVGGR